VPREMHWRESRQKLEKTILEQAVKDRGLASSPTIYELEEMARTKALRLCERAATTHDLNDTRRKIKRGEAL
jgi:hypothetical protein